MNIIHGDCLEELKKLEDNSIDAVICDPPYGLSNTKPQQVADVLKAWVTGDTVSVPAKRGGFMGASWDSFVPPPAVWEECMRVLKPGGHMAVFAGARTQDLMGLSIRLAGFEIRDTLGWIYGSGFPKSHDIGKAIDKRGGNAHLAKEIGKAIQEARESRGLTKGWCDERFCGGTTNWSWFEGRPAGIRPPSVEDFKEISNEWPELAPYAEKVAEVEREVVGKYQSGLHTGPSGVGGHGEGGAVTAPATSEAQRWDGWGTALKPAIEPIILARKPLDGTVANNVLAHGVGGLNIDACRVPHNEPEDHTKRVAPKFSGAVYGYGGKNNSLRSPAPAGRFPANVLLDEHAAKEMDEQSGVLKSGGGNKGPRSSSWFTSNSPNVDDVRNPDSGGASRFFPVFKSEEETPETKGRFPANVLLDEHAAEEMDKQSGVLKGRGNKSESKSTYSGEGATSFPNGANYPFSYDNGGGASRYFPVFKYQAKAPKRERPVIEREDGSKIQHPTVKPVALMEWLVELITPPNGVVLDPFAGSGTTLQAALNKGFTPIGIEQDADYIKLIEKRLAA